MKLSIIVPVFNVEEYIRPCIESILRQGLDEDCYEIIIINDGTPDNSMEVIADIIEAHQNILVINQENQGLSIARNNGLQKASGDYILFVDSDDLLINNCVQYLLDQAISSKADLIVADFLKMSNEQILQLSSKSFIQKSGNIQKRTGKELFLQDLNPYCCQVWRTMYRRAFLNDNNLRFIPHIIFEDIPFTQQCYLKASLCLRIDWTFIIYRRCQTSITSSFDLKKAKDYCIAITKTWELKDLKGISKREQKKLRDDVFITFSKMICNTVHEIDNASERNDIIDFLKQQVPDLHFNNGTKQRIVSFMFRYLPHSYLFIRYLYAKIFEDNIRPFIYHRLRRPYLQL